MRRQLDLRLGIDVGGTNTDAVVLDRDDRLLAKTKAPTTPDVTGGIAAAIDRVLEQLGAEGERITHVMLGTTHATNAILERRNLLRTAVIRIGSPATHAIPPLMTWPADLRKVISAGETIVPGGIEYDGRELVRFDPDAVARFFEPIAGDVEAVAITSVFAPVSEEHEVQARAVAERVLGPQVPVSLSHQVGSIGLLERENATVLNSTLIKVARQVSDALSSALARHGIDPVAFFAQNDGTLMALDYVLRYPVLTIGSGPANSMRGAAYLTGVSDALVADVGGTSTDVGVLVNGFPRESTSPIEIGGVRTNFRMPDVLAIALGGGTVLRDDDGTVALGPDSVGYRVSSEALVFGGATPTLTDAGVAAGRAQVGTVGLDGNHGALFAAAIRLADAQIEEAVDRVKTSKGDRPLIVVGGGSVLVPDAVPGVSEVLRPPHYDVANAIGAAIAAVTGQVDKIFRLDGGGREAALEQARRLALDEAVRAGADPERVEIVDLEEITMAYMAHPVLRIRAKAAGPLAIV